MLIFRQLDLDEKSQWIYFYTSNIKNSTKHEVDQIRLKMIENGELIIIIQFLRFFQISDHCLIIILWFSTKRGEQWLLASGLEWIYLMKNMHLDLLL